MKMSHSRFAAVLVAATMLGSVCADRPGRAAEDGLSIDFTRDIRPILSDKCFACHGPDAAHREADLRLDDPQQALADRGGYRVIAAGDAAGSELVARISEEDADLRMPPVESGKPLTAEQIALLTRWVAAGAVYQRHWSLVPPAPPAVPPVRDGRWPINDVDRFVLARIEAAGLDPSPRADPVTLVRRLCLDLLGLPPTLEQVQDFMADDRPEAYARLVDGLLASPHYGERMAIYWLDLVRYADSVGYHGDQEHLITPYRDYVIHAFNSNLPFDRFTVEQLAGDLLPEATVDQQIASGYNRVLQTSHEGGVQVGEYLHKYDADRIRNLGGAWLGATLGCAECHDHKFDAYSQREFYQLVAFFADVDDLRTFRGGDTSPTRREPELQVLSPLDREEIERSEAQIEQLRQQIGASRDSQQAAAAELQARLDGLQTSADARRKQLRRTMVTVAVQPRTIRILPRGNWLDESGPEVQPGVPACLPPLEVTDGRPTRLDLARWLTAPDHPQTARVFANRLWYLFFGAGLSRSLDDCGSQGEPPVDTQLLDYLATEFVASGWDVKHLVRLLVTSRAYQQASLETDLLRQRDPQNRLFARQGRWRLPAELIRDNALAVSGLLAGRVGGPSARPPQPAGYYAHLNFPPRTYQADQDENQYRRGVYVHWQRMYLHPMLKAFDAPSREECTAERAISNTPSAALTLLNDPCFVEAAQALAARTIQEGGTTPEAGIRWAWQRILSREPLPRETQVVYRLYQQTLESSRPDASAAAGPASELAAWTAVSRALLNLSETITRN